MSGSARWPIHHLKIGTILQTFVSVLLCWALRLLAYGRSVSAMVMEYATKSGVKILVHAVCEGIVLMTYPLAVYTTQFLDLTDVPCRRLTLMADPFVSETE